MTRGARAAAFLVWGVAGWFAGCAAPPGGATLVDPAGAGAPRIRERPGVAARYVPAFEALQRAVESREDASARRIAARLEAQIAADAGREDDRARGASQGDTVERSTSAASELLAGFQRVLAGRELADRVQLALLCRPIDSSRDGVELVELVLEARCAAPDTPSPGDDNLRVLLRPGPATLSVRQVAITPSGDESQAVHRVPTEPGLELVLVPGETLEHFLAREIVGVPAGSLAARTRWTLEFRAGDFVYGDVNLPAQKLHVTPTERTSLAGFLPTEPVEPAEIRRYVESGAERTAALVERAVRIPQERREEALDELAPWVARSPIEEVLRIVPALRWLSRRVELGRDPVVWKRWFERRGEALAEDIGAPGGPSSGLDLPRRASNRRP